MELRLTYKGKELLRVETSVDDDARELRRSAIPAKNKSRLRSPITKGSKSYYGQGCTTEPTAALWVLKDRPERGRTRIATDSEEVRLQKIGRAHV